jgi:hypothetical protein
MKRGFVIFSFMLLMAPTGAHADPFGIQVLSATCSTAISAASISMGLAPTTTSMTGCGQGQDFFFKPDPDAIDGIHVTASADYFATSSFSSAYGAVVSESSDSVLTFATLTDGTAMLGLDYLLGFYGAMYISLYDLTVQELVFEQAWGHSTILNDVVLQQGYGSAGANTLGDLQPTGFLDRSGAVVTPTTFSADHTYALRLHTDGNSSNDATLANLRLSGLVKVPEPSSLFLFGAGLAGLGALKRARNGRPS